MGGGRRRNISQRSLGDLGGLRTASRGREKLMLNFYLQDSFKDGNMLIQIEEKKICHRIVDI